MWKTILAQFNAAIARNWDWLLALVAGFVLGVFAV